MQTNASSTHADRIRIQQSTRYQCRYTLFSRDFVDCFDKLWPYLEYMKQIIYDVSTSCGVTQILPAITSSHCLHTSDMSVTHR